MNNYVARVGSLLAVAVLPALAGISGRSYAHPGALSVEFRKAMVITAAMCVAGGVIAALGIRNPEGLVGLRSKSPRHEGLQRSHDAPSPAEES